MKCPVCETEAGRDATECPCSYRFGSGGPNAVATQLAPEGATTETTAAEMRRELAQWGMGFIAFGTVCILPFKFFDPVWGAMLIAIGVLTLLIRRRGMFIVIGATILLAGLLNILDTLVSLATGAGASSLGFWAVFGAFQLYWGVKEIRKFKWYAQHQATEAASTMSA